MKEISKFSFFSIFYQKFSTKKLIVWPKFSLTITQSQNFKIFALFRQKPVLNPLVDGKCYRNFFYRYNMNLTAAAFVIVGTLWDIGTWYHSKDVQIFDKDEHEHDDTTEPLGEKLATIK